MSRNVIADVSTAVGPKRSGSGASSRVAPALTILSHPFAERVGARLLLDPLGAGKEMAVSRNDPDFAPPGVVLGQPLADPFVSRRPLRFSRADEGGIRLSVDDGGRSVVAGATVSGAIHFDAHEIAAGVPIELADRVTLLLHLATVHAGSAGDSFGMLGQSDGIRAVRQAIASVVDLDVPVLIRGETGTGKELVARAIHDRGARKDRRFVSVNLGAIPKELAAAELFGATKGAYTGATSEREGFFRAAAGGTLFLDEVGEASPEVQVMLLRVLEAGEMYPLGAHSAVATDVRLIAATDADLEERIRAGRFKAPLLHRLAGYEIALPALRERREDIGILFYHFARRELALLGEEARLSPSDPYAEPWLPASVAARIARHAWPGNIRQLRNVTRQLVIASRGQPRVVVDRRLADELSGAGLSGTAPPAGNRVAPPPPSAEVPSPRRKPADVSEAELLAALKEHAWDLKAAADHLGIPRPSIYDRIEKSPSIRTAGDLTADEIERCFHACDGDVDAMVQRLSVSSRALKRRIKELGLVHPRRPEGGASG